MSSTSKPALTELLSAHFARGARLPEVITVLSADGATHGIAAGSTRRCQMEGCLSMRIMVRWPDNKVTWPCMGGLSRINKTTYKIQ